MLNDLIKSIDRESKKLSKKLCLLPPASSEEIASLKAELEDKLGDVSTFELETLYSWHNGQSGPLGLMNDNRVFMTLKDALNTWAFYINPNNEYQEPYERNWFPIMSNGASDYLVMDIGSGALIAYWHDDEEREVEYTRLSDWAADVLQWIVQSSQETETGVEAFMDGVDPVRISVSLSFESRGKDLALAKRITPFVKLSLMEVVRTIGAGGSFVWNLNEAMNSLERSEDVISAKTAWGILCDQGLDPALFLRDNELGSEIAVDVEMLETLWEKCLKGVS